MTEKFDAYHKWLGISPADQPPHHYRLLGINEHEADADVISHAADQRMTHVRSFQSGPRAADAQQLLNEIALARLTLLDPIRRTNYDSEIFTRKPAIEIATETAGAPIASVAPIAHSTKRSKSKGPRPLIEFVKIAVGGVFGIFFAVLLLSYFAGMDLLGWQKKPVTKTASKPTLEASREGSLSQQPPVKNVSRPSTKTTSILPGPVAVAANNSQAPQTQQRSSALPATTLATKNAELSKTIEENVPGRQSTIEKPASSEVAQGVAKTPEPASTVTKPMLLVVPSRTEQDAVRATLSELYKFSAIKSAEQKRELAAKLIELSSDPTEKPAERFTLLRQAAEFARDGGDAELMLRALGEIAEVFDVDREKIWRTMLLQFAERATDEEAITSLFENSRKIVDDLVAAKHMDLATESAEVVLKACQRPNGRKMRKPALDQRNQLRQIVEKWKEVQQALVTLDSSPEDPAASLVYGRYLCLVDRNYMDGLRRLSNGADTASREAAQADLETSGLGEKAEPSAMIKVADQWFSIAKSHDTFSGFFVRAAHWYTIVEPRVSGLEKARVAKRLEELVNLLPKQQASPNAPQSPIVAKSAEKPIDSSVSIESPLVGAKVGTEFFDVAPAGGVLVGMKLATGFWGSGGYKAVASIQPIYRTKDGTEYGKSHGPTNQESNPQEFVAKDGYVVGAVRVVVHDHPRIVKLQLVFMRLQRNRLLIADSYESSLYPEGVDPAVVPGSSTTTIHFDNRPIAGVRGWWSKEEMRGLAMVSSGTAAPLTVRATPGNKPGARHPEDAAQFGKHWYKFMPGRVVWEDAQRQCQMMGGYLVCIESAEENAFVLNLIGERDCVWFGGFKDGQGEWRWVNGNKLSFKGWGVGQPSNDDENWMGYAAKHRTGTTTTTEQIGFRDLFANGISEPRLIFAENNNNPYELIELVILRFVKTIL